MASKSVGLKGGDHGLTHPEPSPHRRNKPPTKRRNATTALKAEPTKRRAVASAGASERREGRSGGHPKRAAKKTPTKKVAKAARVRTAMKSEKAAVPAVQTTRSHTRRNTSRMSSALEDSATGTKPSRKSTRKSANHTKPSQLTRRTQRALHSPEARAARSRAHA